MRAFGIAKNASALAGDFVNSSYGRGTADPIMKSVCVFAANSTAASPSLEGDDLAVLLRVWKLQGPRLEPKVH
jgi:hypothetical protein